jgi:hypothetical protein
MADEIPELPGPDAPTFWNGEPCDARQVVVVVADAPDFPGYWAREHVGQERSAVEVNYGGRTFYLDNDDPPGHGWAKVTLGKGSPRFAHRQLEVSEVKGGAA